MTKSGMTKNENLKHLIKKLGGAATVSRYLGVHEISVRRWYGSDKKDACVPKAHWGQIMDLAQKTNVKISIADLI